MSIDQTNTMDLQQAKDNFQEADMAWQYAWAQGDPTEIANAKKARQRAYNQVSKIIKAQLN